MHFSRLSLYFYRNYRLIRFEFGMLLNSITPGTLIVIKTGKRFRASKLMQGLSTKGEFSSRRLTWTEGAKKNNLVWHF